MPDRDTLARILIERSARLIPGPGSTRQTLEALRFAIAQSLSRETVLEDAPNASEEQLAAARGYFEADAARRSLSALGIEGGAFTLERAGLLQFLTDGPQQSAFVGLKKASRVGPFLEADGREIWFNIYGSVRGRTLYVPGLSRPVLVMTSGRLPDVALARFRLTLDPGTVWILARLLDPAAPEDGYIGFAVTSGSVGLPATPTVAGDRLTLAASGVIDLSLTLAAAPPVSASAACAFGSLTAPANITITLSTPPTFTGIKGNLAIGESAIEIDAGEGVSFDKTWNMIAFRGAPQPEWLDLVSIAHSIAEFSGEVEIERAAWAVPVTRPADPNTLGEADPAASGWLLHLGAGGFVSWPQSNVGPVGLDDLSMLASPARLLVRATSNDPLVSQGKHAFGLWRLKQSGLPLPVTVHTVAPLELVFLCDAQMGEALSLTAQASVALDRPLSALGNPLPALDQPVHLIFTEKDAIRKVSLLARGLPAGSAAARWPLVLENGFFHVRSPKLVLLSGELQDGGTLQNGRLSVHLDVHGFLPTLPDPYVANVQPHGEFGRGGASGALIATIDWSANEPPRLTFRGSPGSGGIALMSVSQEGSSPARDAIPHDPWSATERSRALVTARREREANHPQILEEARAKDSRILELLGGHATEAGITFGRGIRLLDVSTNRHQVGVQIRSFERAVSANTSALTVDGLHVTTSLAGVQVFMLPQVQWEPVITLDRDQDLTKFGYFPTPLASANDGGATLIGSRSMKLAPVIPDLALDRFIETFSAGERVGLVTTLPFGIRAVMSLRPGPSGDALALNDASYTGSLPLQNALQLSARALGGVSVPGNESPSFQGAAAQLLNGVNLVSGTPEGISVLGSPNDPTGSVEGMFNNEFVIERPRVPLTRLDLSGYGASTFSDWANPFAAFAEASKVQFNVLMGRTALEIVKFNSILYPWGIRVTRMVTVERGRNAGVIRRDTGWQPESNGLFDFRYKDETKAPRDSPYVVHPGIFRGLLAIRNIRPAPGATPIKFNSTMGKPAEVLAYHFDCEAVIESAAGEVRMPANGVTGFLHVQPVGFPLTPQDLAGLLIQQSAAGGPVDVEIAIGASGLRTRALRVEVDSAGTGVPDLVAAVRCSPLFGPNGAWSVVRQAGPAGGASKDTESVPDGVPLIREGGIQYLVGTSVPGGGMLRPSAPGPYRFADARDLLTALSPKRDYGFLQTAPTHAFLFRRPQIAAGDTRITSSLAPLFADIYARGTTESLFPPIENSIELLDRPYVLAMNPAAGRFRLDPPVSLPAPRGDLTLGDGVERTMKLVYAKTRLSLTIDEDAWSMNMPALVSWNGFPDLPELIGTSSRLSGSSSGRSMISEVDTLMTGFVETILSFIPGMNPRERPPDIELRATNLAGADKFEAQFFHEVKHLGPFDFKCYGSFFSGREDPANNGLGPPVSYYGVLIGFEFEGQIPIPPFFYLILGLEFEVGTKRIKSGFQEKGKVFIEIKAYVGFGVGTEVPGVYKLLGYIGGGLIIERDKSGWHFGGLGLIKAEMEIISIVEISIGGEFTGIGRREGGHTVTEYKGVVEVNITFLFLSLEASWDLEFDKSV